VPSSPSSPSSLLQVAVDVVDDVPGLPGDEDKDKERGPWLGNTTAVPDKRRKPAGVQTVVFKKSALIPQPKPKYSMSERGLGDTHRL
jgi:hypothetical protein